VPVSVATRLATMPVEAQALVAAMPSLGGTDHPAGRSVRPACRPPGRNWTALPIGLGDEYAALPSEPPPLPLAAVAVGRTETTLGAFYRRLSARVSKAKAVTATARKIAVLFYNTLRHGMEYSDPGASHYEERYRRRVITNLERRARAFSA
jgi:hypothetical protein